MEPEIVAALVGFAGVLIAALFGCAGILIGGILQFFATRYFERRRERRERLLSTYRTLLQALHTLASAQARKEDTGAASLGFEAAKAQFLLDGTKHSISIFGDWFVKYGKLDSPESKTFFCRVLNQLRADCLEGNSDIELNTVSKLLFRE
jgi:hypothetical protein